MYVRHMVFCGKNKTLKKIKVEIVRDNGKNRKICLQIKNSTSSNAHDNREI